ncbi:MAG TPA: Asd/ArgC dimerization domain-containing protein [Edaphobacter sp.]|nr:Asd/ArgC dimerization domain-containing protein [Edaphobacter sp.]
MEKDIYRIGIVGASSLMGKELADELAESMFAASNVVLLDDGDVVGQMTATGEEAAFIQQLELSSFDRMDFVFFAGNTEATKRYWQQARKAGASIIDLTGALEGEKDVLTCAPWVTETLASGTTLTAGPDLSTSAVLAAHPAATMLALVAAKLRTKLQLRSLAATVMEPASESGAAAMDELHQQTVNLLSFQSLPREYYDAQVAFNLLPSFGHNAKMSLTAVVKRIRGQYATLSSGELPPLALQLIQAPVFHGYVASVLVEAASATTIEQIKTALAGEHVNVVNDESDPPCNLSATGQPNILIRVSGDGSEKDASRFWLWLAADNLKLRALNAIACASELGKLRPQGKVQ